ncbi:aminoglycoside phosphotransferase family protein [Kitasatospora sp. NPDC059327]|uniref:aminoglycoside phosphotransferase family protein n=1 Tax=Kitasatospora sp. NPDC059327 TaxID=3346803 RepID=UPI0036820E6D
MNALDSRHPRGVLDLAPDPAQALRRVTGRDATLSSQAREALRQAAAAVGFGTDGGRLLYAHRNWVVRLSHATAASSVIAKIHEPGTSWEAVHRQVDVATWLRRNDVMTARPAGGGRPLATTTGLFVTFAEDLGDGGPVSPDQLGRLLAALHALPLPTHLALPALDPATDPLARIGRVPENVLASADRCWLREYVTAAAEQLRTTPCGSDVLLHGDLNTFNTIASPAGPALIDFENVARGPAAYDLAFQAWRWHGFGEDPDDYQRFCSSYGADVTTLRQGAPYRVLVQFRAAIGVLIALEAAAHDRAWAVEAGYRMECLRAHAMRPLSYPWNWQTRPALTSEPGGRSTSITPATPPDGAAGA